MALMGIHICHNRYWLHSQVPIYEYQIKVEICKDGTGTAFNINVILSVN